MAEYIPATIISIEGGQREMVVSCAHPDGQGTLTLSLRAKGPHFTRECDVTHDGNLLLTRCRQQRKQRTTITDIVAAFEAGRQLSILVRLHQREGQGWQVQWWGLPRPRHQLATRCS